VEQWPDAVNSCDVLDAIADRFSRYVVTPEGAADFFSLWCAICVASGRFNVRHGLTHVSRETMRQEATARRYRVLDANPDRPLASSAA
jgi:hypothetical protein